MTGMDVRVTGFITEAERTELMDWSYALVSSGILPKDGGAGSRIEGADKATCLAASTVEYTGNQVIASGGQGAFIGITPAKGKPLKVEVNEKDRKSVVALCSKIRERATRETLAKAEKYHISLNDEEVKVLTPSKTSATTE